METSAACRAHPVASRTAATMWQESVIAYRDTPEPTAIKVGINLLYTHMQIIQTLHSASV